MGIRATDLSERQQQALRGLEILTQNREQIERQNPDYKPHPTSRYFSAGQVAGPVQGELPNREQHGNGALSKRSWSGRVPYARFIGPALIALVKKGLADNMPRWLAQPSYSDTYAITEEGRKVVAELRC